MMNRKEKTNQYIEYLVNYVIKKEMKSGMKGFSKKDLVEFCQALCETVKNGEEHSVFKKYKKPNGEISEAAKFRDLIHTDRVIFREGDRERLTGIEFAWHSNLVEKADKEDGYVMLHYTHRLGAGILIYIEPKFFEENMIRFNELY